MGLMVSRSTPSYNPHIFHFGDILSNKNLCVALIPVIDLSVISPRNRQEGDDAKSMRKKKWGIVTLWPTSLVIVIIVGVVLLLFVTTHFGVQSRSSSSIRGADASAVVETQRQRRRVIAVGDIHGDKDALVRALQLANLVDRNDGLTWTGGSDIVVQIGDLLNKAEPRDEETLAYILQIERGACAAGGGVVVTVGDHDLHNAPKLWEKMQQQQRHPQQNDEEPFPSWMRAAYVDDRTLFVHGSLVEAVFHDNGIHGSLDEMNRAVHDWIAGKGTKPAWIGRGNGPIWSRMYSSDKEMQEHPYACEELSKLLEELDADRMVVGHTVRREGVSEACDGSVWRIDVGLSVTETRAGKIGAAEVLELSEGGKHVRVLSTDVRLKSWK
mmetsp:Transcript_37677/g.90831  ORF Transcript_37677/g.90831 Transcript_37677/m.90831 type:complete len:383 (+) Transcript_37677:363-1511(+)